MSTLSVAIETSTRLPSVAVGRGAIRLEARLQSSRAHASDLIPRLEELLGQLGASARDLEAVIVGTGPGSYTGLRVGVATALGLVRATGARLFGLPSTETWVFGATSAGEEAAVVIDARSKELYFARYRRTSEGVEVVHPPCVTDSAGLDRLLPAGSLVLADDDAVRAAALERRADLRLDRRSQPTASFALELGLARLAREGPHDAARVEPLYLRAFAAKTRRR